MRFSHLFIVTLLHVCIYLSTTHTATLSQPYVITLFFRPLNPVELTMHDLKPYINTIGSIHMSLLEQQATARRISGIFALHYGTIEASNLNGQITFPRTSANNTIIVTVAPRIIPIVVHGRTIDHFSTGANSTALKYICVRIKKKDSPRGVWRITKQNVMPFEKISPDHIVIFGDPRHIYMFEGEYITDMSHHLILPDIIVDDQASIPLDAIRSLYNNRFFMPSMPWTSYAQDRYANLLALDSTQT